MAANPAPWASPTANEAADAETPAQIFFYVVHAVDGAGESAE
jgi:hypothetical protein